MDRSVFGYAREYLLCVFQADAKEFVSICTFFNETSAKHAFERLVRRHPERHYVVFATDFRAIAEYQPLVNVLPQIEAQKLIHELEPQSDLFDPSGVAA